MANSRVFFSDLKENGDPFCGMVEVVEEVQSNRKENGESSSKPIEDESLKMMCTLPRLMVIWRSLVECEGRSISKPDGFGYYALQWFALNNRTAVTLRETKRKLQS
ncbi:unnamed protein product [Eruca vesicaria subsp. sativa]|uniref:Uncharacterized protein n=1 Tax=Eruca vesicaria subsp. sativa TaxID=29727 RepID=A0ABC8LVK9_ERUVS|nr:unnamed protein product [Eruca vesicaria subsp. sativa]